MKPSRCPVSSIDLAPVPATSRTGDRLRGLPLLPQGAILRYRTLVGRIDRLPPALVALLVQGTASVFTIAACCIASAAALDAPWLFWVLVQATIAMLLATVVAQAPWWVVMHGLFAPAALLLSQVSAPPWIHAGCAALLALTNGNALRERVPLFLSSRAARARLLDILPPDRPLHFVDVGCGLGGVVSTVAREHPTRVCLGLETAWLPYMISRLRCLLSANPVTVLRHDLWQHDLSDADVVYAYLSPVPMARLWRKVVAEMRPGTLFISNSFEVPGVPASASVEIDDATGSVLHVYRLAGAEATAASTAAASAARS